MLLMDAKPGLEVKLFHNGTPIGRIVLLNRRGRLSIGFDMPDSVRIEKGCERPGGRADGTAQKCE
jgi:hypothetical protein